MRPLTAAERALAADPKALAMARAEAGRAAGRQPHLRPELLSAALFALVGAAARYDPAVGTTFAQYAVRWVRGQIATCRRREIPFGFRRPPGRRVTVGPPTGSLSQLVPTADGPRAPLADVLPGGDLPVGWEVDAADAVETLARGLPPRQSVALRLYLTRADCGTLGALGLALGVSQSAAQQMVDKAVRRLRAANGRPAAGPSLPWLVQNYTPAGRPAGVGR